MKKYEFTGKTVVDAGWTMREIRALKDFDDVKAGDLGGYIYNEKNLSQRGKCWVYPGSAVENTARVTGNAKIRENSTVRNAAHVYGNAVIKNADIYTMAKIHGDAVVEGVEVARSDIFGNARIEGHGIGCHIDSSCIICDDAYVYLESSHILGKEIKGQTRYIRSKHYDDTLKSIEELK